MTKTPPEDADPEEENDDDENETGLIASNSLQSSAEATIPTDAFLNLMYLARDESSGANGVIEVPLGNGNARVSFRLQLRRRCGRSDCGCDDTDEYSDGDYDDEDSEIEMILEEIRRISEALLGTTVSELIDAERRVSLKDFDELAARDESLLEEWDYDDSDICEHDDDCQGVAERVPLFMRSHPAQLSESLRREVAELRGTNCRSSRSCDASTATNRRVSTSPPGGTPNIYVVYFEPRKLGMFPKLGSKEESKPKPKLKRTLSVKKATQRVRLDKDSVRRWSEDDEKEEIALLMRSLHAVPRTTQVVAPAPRVPTVPWAGLQISLGALSTPDPSPPPSTPVATMAVSTPSPPPRAPFAVSLPVGGATPNEVHVVLFANRVLAAEVVQHVTRPPAAASPSTGAGDESMVGAAGWLACESVLVRRWLVPVSVDLDTLRCFLGDGLLLIAAYPLPDGFVWPFASPPAALGPPLRVAWACDYVP